jgi:hypothetical protein
MNETRGIQNSYHFTGILGISRFPEISGVAFPLP